jgi:Putative F0F1-ATPase subunit Ca2+/Mg2+ transporter
MLRFVGGPIIGPVLMVGIVLSASILGLSFAGLLIDRWLGTSPIGFAILFVAGNLVGWSGVRWLYLRVPQRPDAGR